jgi:hypothetical protein
LVQHEMALPNITAGDEFWLMPMVTKRTTMTEDTLTLMAVPSHELTMDSKHLNQDEGSKKSIPVQKQIPVLPLANTCVEADPCAHGHFALTTLTKRKHESNGTEFYTLVSVQEAMSRDQSRRVHRRDDDGRTMVAWCPLMTL